MAIWETIAQSNNSDFFFPLSVLKIDMTDHCLMKVLKGHANSIQTGQKAVSIDRMPKHIDENSVKKACLVTS